MSSERGLSWHIWEDPSAYAVARWIGVTHQTVTRCLERAAELGVIEALDDRPRAGRDPVITAEAKTWLVALACRKAKELGYPHELWTTRLLATHARRHGPPAGHPSLAKLAQGTVCKILAEHDVKPHKVRYYLEKRDPQFEPKMAEILCVYRQVAMLRAQATNGDSQSPESSEAGSLAIISYDEKPGIQAIGTTAPDRPPLPGTSPTVMRDHEYKRHGTLTLMAGIDLLTGNVHAVVKERHRSREFIEFLKLLDSAYPTDTAIEVILDNHSADVSEGDHGLACRAARWALYLHLHAQARVMAQYHRGLLLQAGALGSPPHPGFLKTRTQGAPDGLHRRHQSSANRLHLALQNR